jgi:uncharacterized protein (TIGR03118 family)
MTESSRTGYHAMPRPTPSRTARRTLGACAAALLMVAPRVHAQAGYVQTNLVSDIPGLAKVTDPLLVNPWGVSFSGTSPFWVSNAGTGTSTLYNGAGVKQALTVTIPGPGAPGVPGVPTGQVFNGTGSFALPVGGNATFIFASVTGTISGWNGGSGTVAQTVVNGFPASAYTGIALAGTGATARLYAANFGTGSVDVFDGTFTKIVGAGAFADPTLPAGYAPFNVHNVGGQIYVTYAIKDPITGRDVPGAGQGFVNVFNPDGTLVRRFTGGGALNSPWGVALAPSTFGTFGGALLVGNFGDGTINAFDALSGNFRGVLRDPLGAPIVNEGLWEIAFGSGAQGTSTSTLYFAAGIQGETHGLFGAISTVPEPGTVFLVATGLGGLMLGAARRRRASAAG